MEWLFTQNIFHTQKGINKKIFNSCLTLALNPEKSKEILIRLFPNVRWCVENYHENTTDHHRRELRICSPEIFNRYFSFCLFEDEISESDIQKVLSSLGNLDNLSSCFLDLHKRGILSNFLINFDAYKTEIPLQYSEKIIVALLNVGELLSYELNFLSPSDRDYALRLIYYSINSETDSKKKKSYVLNALNKTTAVSLPLYLIGNELDDLEKKKGLFVFDKDDINDLKLIGLKLIHNARNNKSLEKSPNLARILYLWKEWENLNSVTEWLDILFKENKGIVQFLRGFTMKSYSQTLGSHAVNIRWKIDPAAIEKITSFNELIKKVKLIDVSILSSDEQRSIEAALEAWSNKP